MANIATLSPERLKAAAAADEPLAFRQAPHNIEAEQALLGAILVNNESMDRVSSFLEPAHFFDPLHQQIFETAGKLIHAGKQATPITLRTLRMSLCGSSGVGPSLRQWAPEVPMTPQGATSRVPQWPTP